VVRGRVELPTPGFSVTEQPQESQGKTVVTDRVGAVETKTAHVDPNLQAVIDAWPALPEAVKTDILTAVKAAGGKL